MFNIGFYHENEEFFFQNKKFINIKYLTFSKFSKCEFVDTFKMDKIDFNREKIIDLDTFNYIY